MSDYFEEEDGDQGPPYSGSPKKLDDGSWGIRLEGEQTNHVTKGSIIEAKVNTSSGNSWPAQFKIYWVDHSEQVALGEPLEKKQQTDQPKQQKQQKQPSSKDNAVYLYAGSVAPGKPCPACKQIVPKPRSSVQEVPAGLEEEPF